MEGWSDMAMTEKELVKACVDGNMAAQKSLFDKYSRVMMGMCLRYASCREEAEDLAQDGWIKVFERLVSFRFEGSLEGWIKRIMVNTSLDFLRRKKQLTQPIDDSPEGQESMHTEAEAFGRMSAKELIAMIQQLPPGYRSVFNLYAIEGYTHREIGQLLNISESTSKSQYVRAKASLQKMLVAEATLQS
jgi:RNA polymerase sigma factor (sigma-70 family)